MRYTYPLAALCVLAMSLSMAASATTIYVAQHAPGPAHDGATWQTAFTTVETGLAVANAGDEVWVGAGSYTTHAEVRPGVSLYGGFNGFEPSPHQRLGMPGITTLLCNNFQQSILWFGAGVGAETVVNGFAFRGAGNGYGRGALQCTDASPTISNNTFRQVAEVGERYGSGAFIASLRGAPIIANNVLTESPADAIFSDGAGGRIVNNTIVGNGGAGIYSTGPITPLVANNILAFNVAGIRIYRAPEAEMRNNCVFGNPGGNYEGMADRTGQDGNIGGDPRLANYAYGDLHITPDSPCVDAGNDADVVGDRDIDFQKRVLGPRVDIGADECFGPPWAFVPPVVRVAPAGDDNHDGSSWSAAKRTIQAAINQVSMRGGEVWVAAGTYTPAAGAGAQTGIVLPAHVYLYGGFSGHEASRAERDWAANATYLTNTATSNAVITATAGHRVSAVDGFSIVVTAQRSPLPVAMITGRGASPMIENNRFDGTTAPEGQVPVSIDGGFPLIGNNTFSHVSAMAAVVCGHAAPTISNNVFRDNATAIGVIKCIASAPALITNNLFVGNSGRQGIITAEFSARVIGNTFVGNTAETSSYNVRSAGSYFANNIVARNTFKYAVGYYGNPVRWISNNCFYESGGTVGLAGTNGNIATDPEFVDAGSGDYHLRATSPCVDAGDDGVAEAIAVDLDGSPRRQGRHVDIGAYESSASSPSPRWNDIVDALKIAGGLRAATPEEEALLDTDGVPGVGLADAATLVKAIAAE